MQPSPELAVKTAMLIRKPVSEVFEVFVDPAHTTRFWFTRSSGRLAEGREVLWEWEMYGAAATVTVKAIEQDRRILIEWPAPVEWLFEPRGDGATLVTITCTGFSGSGEEVLRQAVDTVDGFSLVLAGCKAYLEHGISLNLVADRHPDAIVADWKRG